MTHGRTERDLSSALQGDRIERALSELKEVLADRAEDPNALAAMATLRDAFSAAHSRASVDPLTGLMNRASFDQALEQAVAHAARSEAQAALMFMDLDGFKSVNDRSGHPVGDQLLRLVAGRIIDCVRDDDLLARYGGDEFVVLLDALAQAEVVESVATRIIQALAKPLCIEGREVHVSISIGVALFPSHGKTAHDLIQRADAAMYCAKRQGGDRYLTWMPELESQSGSYARLDMSQRSTSDTDMPLRRA